MSSCWAPQGTACPRLGVTAARCDTLIVWCYTFAMPTTKPRYIVTDTGEIASCSTRHSDAGPRFATASSSCCGWFARTQSDRARGREAMRGGFRDRRGSSGSYGSDELERLREDWPR